MTIHPKTANRLLWTAQTLLALLFAFAGVMKLVMTAEQMQGPIALPLTFLRFIGIAETLGAFGLILPGLLRIHTELTVLAASGLVIIMTGASALTIFSMGIVPALVPLIVGIAAATIAYRRWQTWPRRAAARKPAFQIN